MSHGFYSRTPFQQQYPPQQYAQQPNPYPSPDTTQTYPAPSHSPQTMNPNTTYIPNHTRAPSEFGATPQPFSQPPYPAQPYASYGQQSSPQHPFSPFNQPTNGYSQTITNASRFQHQHSQSVPAAYPPGSAGYSPSQHSPGTSPLSQPTAYATQSVIGQSSNGVGGYGVQPLSGMASSQRPTSLYGTSSSAAMPPRGTPFVAPPLGSRARSASPLPPNLAGDLIRAPTVASARSLDSALPGKRPLPSAPGIGGAGSLPSVQERASIFESGTTTKQFTYPGFESPAKTAYIPYSRDPSSSFAGSTISSLSSSPPKPTYAAQPSVNPRTAPFDPFGASRLSQLSSSPPKTSVPTFGLGESTRSLPAQPTAPAPPFAPTWPQEKAKLDMNSPASAPTTSKFASAGSSPSSPTRRPDPPFGPGYKREPSPALPPYSSSKPVSPPGPKASLHDENDWKSKRQEYGRERDRAEEAIARANEVGRSILEGNGVKPPLSEAAAIAEEYLARKGLGSRTNSSPERPAPANTYTSTPPTRRFQSPERRANDGWKPSSQNRKDRWAEQKGDYTDQRWTGRRRESPERERERERSPERQEGFGPIPRRTGPVGSSNTLPKSRSQRTFPTDGDYVQHRPRESPRTNGASPTRHRPQASEPAMSPRTEYDAPSEDDYDAPPFQRDVARREWEEDEYEDRRKFEQRPPSRGHQARPRSQSRPDPRPIPREPPPPSPPRTRQASPERPPPRQQQPPQQRSQPQPQPQPQPRPSPQSRPPSQQQRPTQSASPATSPRSQNTTTPQPPPLAPYQSMAMRLAAQALASEGKSWPNNVPQLPRAPAQPPVAPYSPPTPYSPPSPASAGRRDPRPRTPSPPPSDHDEYDEEPREWREPRRDPAPPSPRRDPAPPSPRREPPRREPPRQPSAPPRQEPSRKPVPRQEIPNREPPRREPTRAHPVPPQDVFQEDDYDNEDRYNEPQDEQDWRRPVEKLKLVDVTPKREPLRENTQIQQGFTRPRPPARQETGREAALRRPVPPPPAPAPVQTPAPAPVPQQPAFERPPPPIRSPSPARAPAITFHSDDPAPVPGLPTFSFDLADEPPASGPTISVSSAQDPDPPRARAQFEETPGITVAEDSRPQVQNSRQQEDRVDSPVRHASGLRCAGCDGPIAGRIVSAMGVRWHPHCFKCDDCGTLLEHVSSYENDGKAYCHLDYHDRFAPRCYHCKTPIVDERFIALDDPALGGQRYYHELHFFCAECGDPFLDPSASSAAPNAARGHIFGEGDGDDDVGFTVFNGHPYCEPCHVRLRMPRCGSSAKSGRPGPPGVGCGKPIREEAIEALGRKWHWKCFKCDSCKKPFEDPSFFQREDSAFCDPCYRILLKNEF